MRRAETHVHTTYSNIRLLDSICDYKKLIDYGTEMGLTGLAITDHEVLSAHLKALEYAQKLKEEGKNPPKILLGNEIYLVDERPSKVHPHFILIAKDDIGHHQLRELSSIAWMNSYHAFMTRVDTLKTDLEEIVMKNPGHLIAQSACGGGELPRLILALNQAEQDGNEGARIIAHQEIVKFVLWCKKLFREDFYFEVQPGNSKEQIIVNKRMPALSKAFGIKMVCTSDAHFIKKEDRYIHKSFLNSKEGEREVDEFYEFCYLHNVEQYYEEFEASGYSREFVDMMLTNTAEICDKVEGYNLFKPQAIPRVDVKHYDKRVVKEVEDYPVFSSLFQSDDEVDRYWANQCWEKMQEKGFDKKKEYLDELEEEADVKKYIGDKLGTNMFGYPVLLQHYYDMIWNTGSIVGVSRGSAAAALNHYLLGLTQVDPIQYSVPFFRYMNKENVGLGDIDADVCPSKRPKIVDNIRLERQHYFNPDVSQQARENLGAVFVGTFGTESTKSVIGLGCRGYRSPTYPNGIDNDIAQYLSSLVPSERGFLWELKDVVYGNEEKGRKPSKPFLNEISKYPGLLDIILGVEGTVSRRGIHASGLILLEDDPYAKTAFMRAPSGEITTQYDLGDCEKMGLQKIDLLVTQVCDRIATTIELLQGAGVIEKNLTLRQAYDKYLHPENINLNDEDVWKNIQNVNVLSLFQFETAVGGQGVKRLKPKSIQELSNCNALIRLMAPDGVESPIDHYERLITKPGAWEAEMSMFGLTEGERKAIRPYLQGTYGLGISQEQLMKVLMDKDICAFSLKEANKARKLVSKKKMNEIPVLKEEVFSKAKSQNLANYVWKIVVEPQLGYSFSEVHSLGYSLIGYQTAYLSTKWNPVYWNTACLIIESGANVEDGTTDYDKMSAAINKMKHEGINIVPPHINKSGKSFVPNEETNSVYYALKALTGINSENVEIIINNRPYKGLSDFMDKCPLNKTSMVALIKAGAFDELENKPREEIMADYLKTTAGLKTRITMQNFNALLNYNLIPEAYTKQQQLFKYNSFINNKKNERKSADSYKITSNEAHFIANLCDTDFSANSYKDGYFIVSQKRWKKLYDDNMKPVKDWIKESQKEALAALNKALFYEEWEKYALGSISRWEMESLCYYYHEHEMLNLNEKEYGVSNFNYLPTTPVIEKQFKKGDYIIPIYKLTKIAGTLIAKNKTKSTAVLLTTDGVVNVKFSKEVFANIDKQISEVDSKTGVKTIVEKSWLKRGNMLMITGFRRADTFVAKTYGNTTNSPVYLIYEIDNKTGEATMTGQRKEG